MAIHRGPHPSATTPDTIYALKMNIKKVLQTTNAVPYHEKR